MRKSRKQGFQEPEREPERVSKLGEEDALVGRFVLVNGKVARKESILWVPWLLFVRVFRRQSRTNLGTKWYQMVQTRYEDGLDTVKPNTNRRH